MKITFIQDGQKITVRVEKSESILRICRTRGLDLNAICAGKGICGKCGVQVTRGKAAVSPEDRKVYSEEKLADGWRLACRLFPTEDMEIRLPDGNYYVVADEAKDAETFDPAAEYAAAIDIGTTTLAAQLINLETGNVLKVHSALNGQVIFGADVISRIQASNNGEGEALRQRIRSDLGEAIVELLEGKDGIRLVKAAIAGNTTMIHLLMGYSCETLGVVPFTPVNIDTIHQTLGAVANVSAFGLEEYADTPVVIAPGISTYVGGDIVSGMYALNWEQRENVSLFVDLGTNGEMAIGGKDRILCSSTAAGPAFEGGNITCGTGSVPGAIDHVKITERGPSVTTIGGMPPVGICGTGVIEIAAELYKNGLIDETGLLEEEYFEEGYPIAAAEDGKQIRFYQKDTREIQLAKAAVRAGVETLMRRFGVEPEEIRDVFLAGGFGYKIDAEKAMEIGLLPPAFEGKVRAVGNTSLRGAARLLLNADGEETMVKIKDLSTEIDLSSDKDFNTLFAESMYFGDPDEI